MENGNQPIHFVDEESKDRNDTNPYLNYLGLTKREYFAGIALGAILSGESRLISNEPVAERAVRYADALLKQLEQ